MDPNPPSVEQKSANQDRREPEFETARGGALATDSAASEGETTWTEYADSVKEALGNLGRAVATFFVEFREPLVALLLVVVAAIAVAIARSVLRAINNIPLLAPLLELIGFGYALWFSFRYLLKHETRQELWGMVGELFDETFGKAS